MLGNGGDQCGGIGERGRERLELLGAVAGPAQPSRDDRRRLEIGLGKVDLRPVVVRDEVVADRVAAE